MAQIGDIALVGFSSDSDGKSFSFVILADLAGQVLNFTDNGWLSGGGFRSGEGVVSYTVPAGTAIGTVVTIGGLTGGFNPSTSGDFVHRLYRDGGQPDPSLRPRRRRRQFGLGGHRKQLQHLGAAGRAGERQCRLGLSDRQRHL